MGKALHLDMTTIYKTRPSYARVKVQGPASRVETTKEGKKCRNSGEVQPRVPRTGSKIHLPSKNASQREIVGDPNAWTVIKDNRVFSEEREENRNNSKESFNKNEEWRSSSMKKQAARSTSVGNEERKVVGENEMEDRQKDEQVMEAAHCSEATRDETTPM
ncbi:hypothetical protein HAX54_017073 [Datura stramonium]|uniref:Uncharacterized protein n=1 Tax=Datura stramonium TaxID=4076 RepID=A0ABS8ULX0_DATST|nr:hypothetical protein [Datura stramonium]